jgi:ketosteroid isomerase-like protein
MRRYQAAALVFSLVAATDVSGYAGSASSSIRQDNAAVAELTRLEGVWNDAHVKADTQALDALIADDAVVIVPGMTPMTKQQSLGVLKQGVMTFTRYQTTDVKVRTYETSAIVSGKLRRTRAVGGRSVDDNWQFTKSYILRAGKWTVVAFTASPAPR